MRGPSSVSAFSRIEEYRIRQVNRAKQAPRLKGSSRLKPNPARLAFSLRHIGYTLDQAIADTIDNSITAGAKHVLVRIERTDSQVTRITIADDGHGMSESVLERAMTFGADMGQQTDSLGKYGMGLKLAALSQGEELTVVTRRNDRTCGRRWTIEGIENGWRCDHLHSTAADSELEKDWGDVAIRKHGTLVTWSRLMTIRNSQHGMDRTVDNLFRRFRNYLGLYFHRFLDSGSLQISLDTVPTGSDRILDFAKVVSINPFGYGNSCSGHPSYPKEFSLQIPEVGAMKFTAHIWPAHSESPNYKMGGTAATRQGLYFYRNHRLIQAGGWLDGKETCEPHSSLARVEFNMPPELDSYFSLDVKKCAIRPNPSFVDALRKAKAKDGTPFSDFRSEAAEVYRKASRGSTENLPLVPATGFRGKTKKTLRNLIAPGERRVRETQFEWTNLQTDSFMELDREKLTIRLNSKYRNLLMGSRRTARHVAPLLKTLVFFLVKDKLQSGRLSSRQRADLDRLDQAIQCVAGSARK